MNAPMDKTEAVAIKTASLRANLNINSIPEDLKRLKCWLVWETTEIKPDGKFNKIPKYPKSQKNRSGIQGNDGDKRNLGTFEEAYTAFINNNNLAGIGIAMLENFGIVALDVDRCFIDGEPRDDVMQLTDETYCEISPSGTGIRAFWNGSVSSDSKNHKDGYELFHSKGFVTVTGNQITNSHCNFYDVLPELEPALQAQLERLTKSAGVSSENNNKALSIDVTKPESENHLNHILTLQSVNDQTVENLESALMTMNQDRAERYKQWVDVGLALASLKGTRYEDKALELFHKFSERSNKYDPVEIDAKWKDLNPTKITYKSIFLWAQDDGWANPRRKQAQDYASRIDRTDAGNVALLAQITDGNLRFVPESGVWLHWDSEKWVADQYGVNAQDCALKVAEYYFSKAADIRKQSQDKSMDALEIKRIKEIAESLEKWATHCRNKRSIDAMLNLAKADARFVLSIKNLDQNHNLFGVANGVVDLSTGALREACRDEYVTRRSSIRFNPQAKAPRWCQFIDEITSLQDDKLQGGIKRRPTLARYLKKALGYCLTGSTSEHKMFLAIGSGANGKSILLDITQSVMGEYCKVIQPEVLMTTSFTADAERPTSTLAMLAGARLAICSESKDGQKLDVAFVKRQTGGGSLSARFMRKDTFTFVITHKLWLMTNHKPSLDHMDEAVRGRLHLVPFDMQWNRPGHPERNPNLPDGDKNLMEKLKKEAEGILAWLVKGAVAYHNEDLEPPIEVVRMTQTYFKESDPIARWLDDWCEPCEPKQGTPAKELYYSFREWIDSEWCAGVCPSLTAFGIYLKQRGVQNQKNKKGTYYSLILRTEQKGDE